VVYSYLALFPSGTHLRRAWTTLCLRFDFVSPLKGCALIVVSMTTVWDDCYASFRTAIR
jgi:hypothetical protein